MLDFFSDSHKLLQEWFNARPEEERVIDHNLLNIFKTALYEDSSGHKFVVGLQSPPPAYLGIKLVQYSTFIWRGPSGSGIKATLSNFIEISRYVPQKEAAARSIFIDLDFLGPVGTVAHAFNLATSLVPIAGLNTFPTVYISYHGYTYVLNSSKLPPDLYEESEFVRIGLRALPAEFDSFPGFGATYNRSYSAPATARSMGFIQQHTMYLIPVMLPRCQIGDIGIKVGPSLPSSTRIRLGLYNGKLIGGRYRGAPGRLLFETSEIFASAESIVSILVNMPVADPGIHYLAIQTYNANTAEDIEVQHHTISVPERISLFGSDDLNDGPIITPTMRLSKAYGAFPPTIDSADVIEFVNASIEPHVWVKTYG